MGDVETTNPSVHIKVYGRVRRGEIAAVRKR